MQIQYVLHALRKIAFPERYFRREMLRNSLYSETEVGEGWVCAAPLLGLTAIYEPEPGVFLGEHGGMTLRETAC